MQAKISAVRDDVIPKAQDFGITSVTSGEKCHSGGILFQSSTVLSRNKMLSA
jgi:hypothetical protein